MSRLITWAAVLVAGAGCHLVFPHAGPGAADATSGGRDLVSSGESRPPRDAGSAERPPGDGARADLGVPCPQGHRCAVSPVAQELVSYLWVRSTSWPADSSAESVHPVCPDGKSAERRYHAKTQPHACTCGACGMVSAICTLPTIHRFLLPNCTGGVNVTPAVGNICQDLGPVVIHSFKIVAPGQALGPPPSCPGAAAQITPAAPWTQILDLCPALQVPGTCPKGQICVSDPPPGWAPKLCVPATGTTGTIEAWAGFVDDRACTPCCTPPPLCASGSYSVWPCEGCAPCAPTKVAGLGVCTVTSAATELAWSLTAVVASGETATCTLTPSKPSGAVNEMQAGDLACAP